MRDFEQYTYIYCTTKLFQRASDYNQSINQSDSFIAGP